MISSKPGAPIKVKLALTPARRCLESTGLDFRFEVPRCNPYLPGVTADMFKQEIAEALKAYEKFIVCLNKTPDECAVSLQSLVGKAIKAFEARGPNLRHGIALDRHVTVILSQTESERPLCGIYFNLHSPYHRKSTGKVVKRS